MSGKVITIRARWWMHGIALLLIPGFATLGAAMGSAGLGLLAQEGGWLKAPIILIGAAVFMIIVIGMLNVLFTYRIEIDARGLRLVGNFWTHDLTWQEITRIERRSNARAPGYHVAITVDGSRYPRRHWSNFWISGYPIPSLMEMGATELTAFLQRKRRNAIRRQRAEAAQ